MLYIQESLAPGEKILKYTQYHWLYVGLTVLSASIFIFLAIVLLFLGVIYHYYDIVKLPPWRILDAASELAFTDYIKAIWHTNIFVRVGAFILMLMAIIQIGARILVRITTEMGVTNRRVVYKRGLISRKVEEMRVDFIDGADVEQTIMGRIFNYGRIKMYGTGAEGIIFPAYMEDPVNFRRAIQAARAVQTSDTVRPQVDPGEPHHPLHQQHHAPQHSQHRITPTSEPISPEELKGLPNLGEPAVEPPPGSQVRHTLHEKI